MGMLEPIRRGSAKLLYASKDGVLLRERKSGSYMISAVSFERGKQIIDSIPQGNLFTLHQPFLVRYTAERFKLRDLFSCVQSVYLGLERLNVMEGADIRKLDRGTEKVVLAHYCTVGDPAYIEKLLREETMYGVYAGDTLAGFAGFHPEGSIGLMEIFPEFRRRGYGAALQSYLANLMLDRGYVPFGQIFPDNRKSLALQRKLGFQISQERLYWLF
jgi:GNAT superfamily N-acetyltransferase